MEHWPKIYILAITDFVGYNKTNAFKGGILKITHLVSVSTLKAFIANKKFQLFLTSLY